MKSTPKTLLEKETSHRRPYVHFLDEIPKQENSFTENIIVVAGLGVVAQTCNPTYIRSRDGRTAAGGEPRQLQHRQFCWHPISTKPGMVVNFCNPSYEGAGSRRS
jgi:hypothetical protein